MTYKEIIKRVSAETGLSETLIDRTYKSYWKVIREHITSLPLKKDLTDEEFLKLKTSVNIPSIGKLSVTLDKYKKMKALFKKLNAIKNATHNED